MLKKNDNVIVYFELSGVEYQMEFKTKSLGDLIAEAATFMKKLVEKGATVLAVI